MAPEYDPIGELTGVLQVLTPKKSAKSILLRLKTVAALTTGSSKIQSSILDSRKRDDENLVIDF